MTRFIGSHMINHSIRINNIREKSNPNNDRLNFYKHKNELLNYNTIQNINKFEDTDY